ncbi:MAG: hypothetical protein WBN88_07590, partial [Anderseniella sp.]
GAHQLGVNAEGAYQISNGVDTPVVLKLSSLDVTPTTFDGWSAIQAEATATGFTVLWQAPSGDYAVWQTDAAGNHQNSSSWSSASIQESEPWFAADVDGDGQIGAYKLIEDNGAYELSISEFGAYQFSNGVDTSVNLKLNSLDVKPTTFDGWSALQAEATATGFAVLWQAPTGDYTVWQTDAAGNHESSYGLPESSLIEVETMFAADLNNDGGIGFV